MVNLDINESRIKPVTAHFWPKRYDLSSEDLDVIDGTFLNECCGEAFAYLDSYKRMMDQGDRGAEAEVDECRLSGLVDIDLVVPGRHRTTADQDITLGVQMPVTTVAFVSVQNREWKGERVEREMRRLVPPLSENYPFSERIEAFRLPEECVQPPLLQLILRREPGEDPEPGSDSTGLIRIAMLVHATTDGFPPQGIVAATYDAVTARTGWRKQLRETRPQNQEPAAAIRGWAISLKRAVASQTVSEATGWFASEFPGAQSNSEKSFFDARDNLIERVPEVASLKGPPPSKKRG